MADNDVAKALVGSEALSNYLLEKQRRTALWHQMTELPFWQFPGARMEELEAMRQGLGDDRYKRFSAAPTEELKGPDPEYYSKFPYRQK